ncbi:hypothetical protein B0T16DRAFT_117916 [Cercophora newfieldiana]|uniref:Uncharacterized protein n=1 Tax=Cercophora newfieldiana TaxID=92897 RepID=A0AA39Y9Q4_9PEZI|nr:hypothetical protein B0T16DRAFT_117916 [Cercophora newfieldiana]
MEPIFSIEDAGEAPPPAPPLARVELLPAEIRRSILFCIDDLEDLRAMVLASRAYRAQYLLERKRYLCQTLKASLGTVLVDAYAVQDATSTPYTSPEDVRSFLKTYATMHITPRQTRPSTRFVLEDHATESDVVSMAAFYRGCMRTLPETFVTLFHQTFKPQFEACTLSATERLRLLRGLYRFHLYCILFGNVPFAQENPKALDSRRGATCRDLSSEDKMEMFFLTFPPWEAEEIASIHCVIQLEYDSVLDKVKEDFHRDHSRFSYWNDMYTPPGAWPYPTCQDDYAEGMPSRGIQVFHQILTSNSHDKLVELVDKYSVRAYNFFQDAVNDNGNLEIEEVDDDQAVISFTYDTEERAPLAWVRMAKGIYRADGFGNQVPDNLKEWGIVFWDSERLDRANLDDDEYALYSWFY